MKLLLDTHALIWWIIDSPRLSKAARSAIAEPRNSVVASIISGYEIAYKQRLGKLPAEIPDDLSKAMRDARVRAQPLTLDHMIAAGRLPGPHRDPWDRLIMAQAMADGLTVVTIDRVFRDYGVPVCW
jgi:PIN domain nuclease of toxin-antitoxin system